MEDKKKKKDGALARMTPDAIKVTYDGQELTIASSKKENDILNMVLAAQVRSLIQATLKKYKDQEIIPTPKELKEIAEAARNAAEFSGDIYKGSEEVADPEDDKKEKKVNEEAAGSLDDISFEVKPPDIKS